MLNNLSIYFYVLCFFYFIFCFFKFSKSGYTSVGAGEESGKMTDETGWQVLPVELQTIILSFLPPKVQISLQVKNSVSNTCVDIEHLAS